MQTGTTPKQHNDDSPVNKYLAFLTYEKHYSQHTIKGYQRDLQQFQNWLNSDTNGTRKTTIEDAGYGEIQAYTSHLHRAGMKGKTLQRKLSSLRNFYTYLLKNKLIKNNPAIDIYLPKSPRKLPETLNIELINRLLSIPDNTPLAARDKAIMELFYSSGLRLSELTELNIDTINWSDHSMQVMGKGNKSRHLPIGSKALQALEKWHTFRPKLANHDENALFVSNRGTRISTRSPDILTQQ